MGSWQDFIADTLGMGQVTYPGFLEGDRLFSQWEIHQDWGIYSEYVLFFGDPLSKSKL